MAKKKFNISSTLKKNKKEEVKLAPKVPLKKTAKDPEKIKSRVEEIHADEIVEQTNSPEESPKIEKAKTTPKPAKTKKTVATEKPRIVRMTIDTPEDIHLQLKIKSIQARMSMRDYVLRLIDKDLKKG